MYVAMVSYKESSYGESNTSIQKNDNIPTVLECTQ